MIAVPKSAAVSAIRSCTSSPSFTSSTFVAQMANP